MREREKETTQYAQLLLLFHRLILLLSLFFLCFLSLLVYVYIYVHHKITALSKEKDELLAHTQTNKRALCINVTIKKAITVCSEERERENDFLFLPVYGYMCNHVIVTLLPCFLLLFTSEQIDFLRYFFLFFLHIYIKHMYKKKLD
jgi:hypothetical protein